MTSITGESVSLSTYAPRSKFLVDSEGKVVARSDPKPTPEEIEPKIAALL